VGFFLARRPVEEAKAALCINQFSEPMSLLSNLLLTYLFTSLVARSVNHEAE
jgi:hypothetical protein